MDKHFKYCDRCKKDITKEKCDWWNGKPRSRLIIHTVDSMGLEDNVDLCNDCKKKFWLFMDTKL